MDRIVEILYVLSTALLLPVIFTLFACLASAMVTLGGFLREWRERGREQPAWQTFRQSIQPKSETFRERDEADCPGAAGFFDRHDYPGLLGSFAKRGGEIIHHEIHASALVSELELEAARRLAWVTFGVRIGPVLGLMGTLIPMGPALVGLSKGNFEEMSADLVVAFCTTVLGLFCSAVFYAIFLVRRQWYAGDLSRIEYVVNLFCEARDRHDDAAETNFKTGREDFCSKAAAGGA